MRKFIFIINAIEVIKLLKAGKKLQGVLSIDDKVGLTFKPNNPPRTKIKVGETLGHTDFGRVSRTQQFLDVFLHFPIAMGMKRIVKAIDREVVDVKDLIETSDIVDRV